MTKVKLFFILIFAQLIVSVVPLRSEQSMQEKRKRWNQLSEPEKARLRENYKKWKALPQDRRAAIERRAQVYLSLTPEERAQLKTEAYARTKTPPKISPSGKNQDIIVKKLKKKR